MGGTLNAPVEDNPDLDPYYVERGRQQLIERERAERRDAGVPPEVRVPASERVPSAPTPRPPRQSRISDPTIAAAVEQLPESMRAGAEAQYDLLQRMQRDGTGGAAAQRDLALASGEREAREGYAATQRQELARMRERYVQTPDFVPTQENALSIGTLFGLLGVTAAMTGTAGKRSAVGAMNAMSGMLQGWRQGRSDLYNRERQNFDVEMRRVQAQNQALEREFKDALDLAKTDMDAGIARAREVAARYGVSIAGAAASRQGMQGMLSFLQSVQNTNMQLERYRNQVTGQAPIARMVRGEDGEPRFYAANRATGELIRDPSGQLVEMAPPRGQGSASGPGGAVQFRYNSAVSNAVSQAALELKNVSTLPAMAAPPALANYVADPNKTITEGLLRLASQRITTTEERATQQILAGITRAITTIQASGRPGGVTESSLREFSRIAPQPGDTRLNWYLFLALAKQELDLGLIELRNSGANREQIESATKSRDEVAALIPYNVADINRILVGPRGRPLINERALDLLQHSGSVREAERGLRRAARDREAPQQTYNSAEDVADAYRNGRLTREQAADILRQQFGAE